MAQAGAAAQDAAAQMTSAGRQAKDAWSELAAATIEANTASQIVKSTLKAIATGEVPLTTRVTNDLALAQREAAEAARQLAATQREVKAAMGEASAGMVSARMQATMLSSTMGLGLGRGMEAIISRTPILAAGMSAVFPLVTAFAFFAIAEKIGEKLGEWISDAAIFTKEMKAAYDAELVFNKQLADEAGKQAQYRNDIFVQTHTESQVRQRDLDDEKTHQQQLLNQIQANQAAQRANAQKQVQERSTPQTVDTEQGQMSVPGEVSPETVEQSQELQRQAELLNQQLATSKLRVDDFGNAYKKVADDQAAQARAEAEQARQRAAQAQRELERQAALQMQLKDAGLDNVVKSMPGGDVTANFKPDLSHVAEIIKQAHAEAMKDLDEEAQKRAGDEEAFFRKQKEDMAEAARAARELREENDLKAQNTRDKGLGDVAVQETRVKGQAETGQINPQQELQQLQSLHEQQLAIERAYIAAKLAIDAGDDKAYLKDLNDQVKIEQKGAQQKLQDEAAQLKQSEQAYRQWSTQVSGTVFSGVNSWMMHQRTFTQGMKEEWNSVAMSTVKVFEQMGEKWIATHLLMKAASLVFHTSDVAQHTAAASAKAGVDAASLAAQQTAQVTMAATTSLTNVMAAQSYAAVAAAAALASISAIPIVGPAMAPGVAAGILAIGEDFTAMAAFDYGGIMPKTGVALVHQSEGVLTGPTTSMLQQVNQAVNTGGLQRGDGGGSSGAPDVHYHDNRKMLALDGRSMSRVLRRNSGQVFKEVSRAMNMRNLGRIK